jgi:RecA/RadA recombinase
MDLVLEVEQVCGARLASKLLYRGRVPTGCGVLDAALGGGFRRGTLTELFGGPASGRTQAALSACATAVSSGAAAVYVDADGSFLPERARELVDARRPPALNVSELSNPWTELALDHWLLYRVCSFDELAAGFAHIVPELVRNRGDVRIVVVDSVSQPFRTFERQGAQKRLEAFAGRMAELAMRYDVAVVLINSARAVDSPMPSVDRLPFGVAKEVGIPAMGDAWAHVCPCRVGFGRNRDGERVAHVIKDSRMPRTSCTFKISNRGIDDTS